MRKQAFFINRRNESGHLKNLIGLLFPLLLYTNCTTHRITRPAYQQSQATSTENCEVFYKKNFSISGTGFEKAGEIELGQARFYVSCSEKEALELLRQEACKLNAALINITEETSPYKGKSCYSCKAEFYKVSLPGAELKSDERYEAENIEMRDKLVPSKEAKQALPFVIVLMISTILLSRLYGQ